MDRPRYGLADAHQHRPSLSCSWRICRTSAPCAARAGIPVSREAAWLNTSTRPAWSAMTRPSGSSSAQAIGPPVTATGTMAPASPAVLPGLSASWNRTARPCSGARSPGTLRRSTRVSASVRHVCRVSRPALRPAAGYHVARPPPATWLRAPAAERCLRSVPPGPYFMTQCDQTLARCGGSAAAPSFVNPLCPGGGVQAHRRRRGQVQALCLPINRHGNRLVGEREKIGGQAPRLVAEQPRGRLAEHPPWLCLVKRLTRAAVRGQ